MCIKCPSNTYSNSTAAQDQGACNLCMTNSQTNGSARVSLLDCVCTKGFEYYAAQGCSIIDPTVTKCQESVVRISYFHLYNIL